MDALKKPEKKREEKKEKKEKQDKALTERLRSQNSSKLTASPPPSLPFIAPFVPCSADPAPPPPSLLSPTCSPPRLKGMPTHTHVASLPVAPFRPRSSAPAAREAKR